MAKKLYDKNGNVVKGAKVKKPFYKKWWFIALGVVLVIGAFSGGDDETQGTNPTENIDAVEAVEEVGETDYNSTPIVTIEELPHVIEIEEPTPDSAGSVYGIASFTNQSEYPIVGFTLRATLLDTNENTYYSMYDTVMPGNQSANFESFAPGTGDLNDLEVKVIEYTIRLEDDSEQFIEYDTQLESYDVFYSEAE